MFLLFPLLAFSSSSSAFCLGFLGVQESKEQRRSFSEIYGSTQEYSFHMLGLFMLVSFGSIMTRFRSISVTPHERDFYLFYNRMFICVYVRRYFGIVQHFLSLLSHSRVFMMKMFWDFFSPAPRLKGFQTMQVCKCN
jgi:hypothetical protein